jgi:MEMO1 family protein
MLTSQKPPEEFPEYDEFVSALGELVSKQMKANKKVLVLAGVDMAHVGPHFGDEKPLTPEFMEQVRQRDSEYIETITKRDKKAMFSHIASDLDARKICGFPTMYTLLDLFERLGISYKTDFLDYHQAVDYDSGCAVTFASISCS